MLEDAVGKGGTQNRAEILIAGQAIARQRRAEWQVLFLVITNRIQPGDAVCKNPLIWPFAYSTLPPE